MGDAELPRYLEKPWGGELWFAHTDRYAGKVLHVKAGRRLSVQYHVSKDETSLLLSGRIALSRGDSPDALVRVEIEPGGAWRTEPGEVHSVEALEDSQNRRGLDSRARRCRAPGRRLRPGRGTGPEAVLTPGRAP